jgi:hypothetical protein
VGVPLSEAVADLLAASQSQALAGALSGSVYASAPQLHLVVCGVGVRSIPCAFEPHLLEEVAAADDARVAAVARALASAGCRRVSVLGGGYAAMHRVIVKAGTRARVAAAATATAAAGAAVPPDADADGGGASSTLPPVAGPDPADAARLYRSAIVDHAARRCAPCRHTAISRLLEQERREAEEAAARTGGAKAAVQSLFAGLQVRFERSGSEGESAAAAAGVGGDRSLLSEETKQWLAERDKAVSAALGVLKRDLSTAAKQAASVIKRNVAAAAETAAATRRNMASSTASSGQQHMGAALPTEDPLLQASSVDGHDSSSSSGQSAQQLQQKVFSMAMAARTAVVQAGKVALTPPQPSSADASGADANGIRRGRGPSDAPSITSDSSGGNVQGFSWAAMREAADAAGARIKEASKSAAAAASKLAAASVPEPGNAASGGSPGSDGRPIRRSTAGSTVDSSPLGTVQEGAPPAEESTITPLKQKTAERAQAAAAAASVAASAAAASVKTGMLKGFSSLRNTLASMNTPPPPAAGANFTVAQALANASAKDSYTAKRRSATAAGAGTSSPSTPAGPTIASPAPTPVDPAKRAADAVRALQLAGLKAGDTLVLDEWQGMLSLFACTKERPPPADAPEGSEPEQRPRHLCIASHRLLVLSAHPERLGCAVVKSNHHLSEIAKLSYSKKHPKRIVLWLRRLVEAPPMTFADATEAATKDQTAEATTTLVQRVYNVDAAVDFMQMLQAAVRALHGN